MARVQIGFASSYYQGVSRWREMRLYRDTATQGLVLEEVMQSGVTHTASHPPEIKAEKLLPTHVFRCRRCGGGPVGEGPKSKETLYTDADDFLSRVKPRRGLPLEVAWAAAMSDQDFCEALLDYLDQLGAKD